MTDPASPARGSVAELENFWVRSRIGWTVVYLGLLALVALFTVVRDELTLGAKLVALALLAVMTVSYLLRGRNLLGEDCGTVSLVQVALTWGCFYGLVIVSSGTKDDWGGPEYVLLFMLFPQIWAYLSTRRAVVATIIVIAGLAMIEIGLGGWDRQAVIDVLPSMLLQLGLALLLGLFITGIIEQAERRAVLIDELERTRAELATTEHARGVLAERERLAREIHDTLAQSFTSILTLSQATEVTVPPNATAAREQLALIEKTAREGLAEARALGRGGRAGRAAGRQLGGGRRAGGRAIRRGDRAAGEDHGLRSAPLTARQLRSRVAAGDPGGAGERPPARRAPGRPGNPELPAGRTRQRHARGRRQRPRLRPAQRQRLRPARHAGHESSRSAAPWRSPAVSAQAPPSGCSFPSQHRLRSS